MADEIQFFTSNTNPYGPDNSNCYPLYPNTWPNTQTVWCYPYCNHQAELDALKDRVIALEKALKRERRRKKRWQEE